MPKQQSGSEVDACSWWLSKWKPFSSAASCSSSARSIEEARPVVGRCSTAREEREEGGMEWSDASEWRGSGVWWTVASRKRRRIAGSSSGGGGERASCNERRSRQRLKKKDVSSILRRSACCSDSGAWLPVGGSESSAGELSEGLIMDRQPSSRYDLGSSRASSLTPPSSCCCCCCCCCLDNNYDGGGGGGGGGGGAAAECGGYGSEAGYRGDGECGFGDVDDRDEEEKKPQGHDQRMIELGNPKQPSRLRQRLHRRQKRWKLVEALSSRQLGSAGLGRRGVDVFCL